MKKLVLSLILALISFSFYPVSAKIVQQGNTFKSEKTVSKAEDEKTNYIWEDSKGNKYPIYKTKKGACYVIRVSKNTGKEYKSYLPKEIREKIK